jgi:hypothetical protein
MSRINHAGRVHALNDGFVKFIGMLHYFYSISYTIASNINITYTVTRRTVKFPYIHMMTPDDNGPRRENISRMRAG